MYISLKFIQYIKAAEYKLYYYFNPCIGYDKPLLHLSIRTHSYQDACFITKNFKRINKRSI